MVKKEINRKQQSSEYKSQNKWQDLFIIRILSHVFVVRHILLVLLATYCVSIVQYKEKKSMCVSWYIFSVSDCILDYKWILKKAQL